MAPRLAGRSAEQGADVGVARVRPLDRTPRRVRLQMQRLERHALSVEVQESPLDIEIATEQTAFAPSELALPKMCGRAPMKADAISTRLADKLLRLERATRTFEAVLWATEVALIFRTDGFE